MTVDVRRAGRPSDSRPTARGTFAPAGEGGAARTLWPVMLVILLCLLAAAANAAGSVLQRLGVRTVPHGMRMSVPVLRMLVRRPVWVLGVAAMLAGLALQAAALAFGPIVLIQPLLISELGFALVLSGVAFGSRLRPREWAAVLSTAGSVALLLVALAPAGGDPSRASADSWLLGCVLTVGAVAALVTLGHRNRHAHRAVYLGMAAGVWFAFTAALVAAMTDALGDGGVAALVSAWQTYAMVLAGPAGFLLLQSMLRAGRLEASQPALVLSNPLAALGWGVVVFGETVRGEAWITVEVLAAVIIAVSTAMLARSSLLTDDRAPAPGRGSDSDQQQPRFSAHRAATT
ncbi:DMT family transporter [Prauserella sp. PE36]|uniref:DMT family transporter n=1 Tax=Prauserella sp. PE36 TaxID=1504709 RepID=UPI001F48E5BB|nr:DMT family transporter [Prauserella sp. PE36]